ncbi:MAG: hypothetical protein EPO31_03815 [Gammaproteobacteria bacterium]|nr:MAG: hypothetical protein EPO31_03815 [Gammaproteobacteria bacterium]
MDASKLIASFALSVLILHSVAAQPADEADLPKSGKDEILEEIVVIGERSTYSLRQMIIRAEDRIYDLFNTLNDDKYYDIYCYMEAPINSHIKRRACRPRFVDLATADEARSFMDGTPGVDIHARIAQDNAILRRKIAVIMKENPEFLDAVIKYAELKSEVRKEINHRFGKDE